MAMENTAFSFMTSGPKFRFSRHSVFDRVPELASPLLSGIGGRSFVFSPKRANADLSGEGISFVDVRVDREGRNVQIYEMDRPLQWFLRWKLTNGALLTHLREEDGRDRISTVLEKLSLLEDDVTGTPFLLPEDPLRSFVSSQPGYQEFASFYSESAPGSSLTFMRPGYIQPGRVMMSESSSGALIVRAGGPFGIEIQVVDEVEEQAQELADGVVQSLEEVY